MLVEVHDPVASHAPNAAGSIRNPFDRNRRIHAVLFDLDGTLYRQAPIRVRMAGELAVLLATRPRHGRTVVRVLSEYRRAQESLRHSGGPGSAWRQTALAAQRTGVSPAAVSDIVNEWMVERPARHLRRWRAAGAA